MSSSLTPQPRSAVAALDQLIRGQLTSAQLVRSGVGLPIKVFLPWAIALGAVYGFFIGWYALTGSGLEGLKHMAAVMVKLPALFLCTLLVTFPSLYVFNALLGCRLGFHATLRLLVATIVVNLAIAASLGPILGFFTLSTKSYGFMVLLNVVLLAVAGLVSVGFLIKTLTSLQLDANPPAPPISPPAALPRQPEAPYDANARYGPTARLIASDVSRGSVTGVFWVWIMTYGIVGAQMGWILRPFIGAPGEPFQLFRPRDGSFLLGVYNALQKMM